MAEWQHPDHLRQSSFGVSVPQAMRCLLLQRGSPRRTKFNVETFGKLTRWAKKRILSPARETKVSGVIDSLW